MANLLYDTGRNAFSKGLLHWSTSGTPDTFRVGLVRSTYTYNATHQYFTHLGTNIIGNSGNNVRTDCPTLTLIEPTSGVCDANDVTISGVTGIRCDYVAIFKDTGNDSTSDLVALIDTATGLPVTPNSGDISIAWDSGANKIFKL